uniref:Integrase catalytic domain-containing protein n=1 Tax=Peronospora matthiolae TaxID=2874970 RepID=A0AAV1UA25_9STRA
MMDEEDDVLEHINKLKTMAEQLDAVGAPVSEDDLVITLLDMKRKEQDGGVDGFAHGQGQAFVTSNHSKRKGGRPVQKAINGDNIKLSEEWMVDSGVTQHMTYSKEYMKKYQKISPVDVHLADDGVVQAVGKGDIIMSMRTKHGVKKGVLTGVWHIPKLTRNLFSVGRFTKDIVPVTFESDGCFAQSKSVKWQLATCKGKGLFKLCVTPLMLDEAKVSSSTDPIVKKGYGIGINSTSVQQWEMCQGCALGKQTRVSFMPKSPESAKKMLEVIHSGVCGPMQTASLGGSRYFVTFIDEYSHFSVVFLLKNKSKVASEFAEFVAFAETQTGNRFKLLRSNNGGEYKSDEMTKLCSSGGIVIGEMRSLHVGACRTVQEYLGEAVVTATFLRNRCPTRATSQDKSPHQIWTGEKPLVSNLKVFGCHPHVTVPKQKRTKFDAQSVYFRFIGYSEHEKAYRFEEIKSRRVLVSRDAKFMEDVSDMGDAPKETQKMSLKVKKMRVQVINVLPYQFSLTKKTLRKTNIRSPSVSATRKSF